MLSRFYVEQLLVSHTVLSHLRLLVSHGTLYMEICTTEEMRITYL